MATLGSISSTTDVSLKDIQNTTNAPTFPQTITVTSSETYKRYTAIGANGTINLSGGLYGDVLYLYLQNDASSARTITWGTNILAQASTIVLTVSKETVFVFRHNGTAFLLTSISSAL
jgi:hypothetical protein